MATFDAILIPAQVPATVISSLGTSTSSAEQALGSNIKFAINATQDITIRFGAPGFATAASANDFRIPANATMVFDSGRQYTSFKVFNLSATNACNVYIQFMSIF